MRGILLNEDQDLAHVPMRDADGKILSGITIGNTDNQRAWLIINTHKGEWKEHPTLGFGIERYIKKAIRTSVFTADLQRELKADGLTARIYADKNLKNLNIEIVK